MKWGDSCRKIKGEDVYLEITGVEERRHGEQRGLDTLVVHAVKEVYVKTKRKSEVYHLGSKVARSELKGIGEYLDRWWIMLVNLIIHKRPYQV